jgi:flavin reductase (DIM6/NTAB) family NADH-FMN oxidoreductase RutF
MKKPLALSKVYTLLEPGPVVLISTAHKGERNVMALTWQTMMEFEPPVVGFVLSNRNYSFELLKASKECVINIPDVNMIKTVVRCGSTTGCNVDKFAKFDLTPVTADMVKAPHIKECFANLECRVIDSKLVSKYCFFVLEVVKAWIDSKRVRHKTIHHAGGGVFVVDGEIIKSSIKVK